MNNYSNQYGEVIAPQTIRFQRLLPGSPERVWEYLTDSEKRGRWLATGPMDDFVGGRVELKFLNSALSSEPEETPEKYLPYENDGDGVGFTGTITRYEPPHLLSFTWAGEEHESEVTFHLTPEDDSTLLTITHRRLATFDEEISVSGGWHTHLGILENLLDDQPAGKFWSTYDRLDADYRQRRQT